jgi:hypothetical protein
MMDTVVFYVNTDATLPAGSVPVAARVYRVKDDADVVFALMDDLHSPMPRMIFVGGSDAEALAELNGGEYVLL